ncbi:hypothetical protein [Sphingobacterium deserti]|uniref:Uncharacterized protein n=1 Tax=Sphingobacterium deserti TaxID=1229276 RepID=A0A0B8T871_9SPHI|nr:hypothetical protein [Sphingobacterium deserti]KGE14115.1 hypothetical protein DI53_2132 [Sphingobacterium deserti]
MQKQQHQNKKQKMTYFFEKLFGFITQNILKTSVGTVRDHIFFKKIEFIVA